MVLVGCGGGLIGYSMAVSSCGSARKTVLHVTSENTLDSSRISFGLQVITDYTTGSIVGQCQLENCQHF